MPPRRFPHDDRTALARLCRAIEIRLVELEAAERPVVFACVGTDRSTGDALGPLVGERLLRLGCADHEVLGSLDHPLHALNLVDRLQPRIEADPRTLVIAVDAALGSLSSVGSVALGDGALRPGAGVGKDLPPIGEMSLTATVNVQAGALDVQVLQSTRLWLVQQLVELISSAAWWALGNARREGAKPALAGLAASS